MKQNRFCTAANKTAEICKRDFGSTSLRSYHRLFFPRYLFLSSSSFRRSCARGLLIWQSPVTFLFLWTRHRKGCAAAVDHSPPITYRQNWAMQFCNSLHVDQDWGRGTRSTRLLKSSSWTDVCKTKALNVIQYMGQRDLSKLSRMGGGVGGERDCMCEVLHVEGLMSKENLPY